MMRTHRCGELRAEHAGSEVTLRGWVHHRRDHGKVIFIDLRDATGPVQVVFHPENAPEATAVGDEMQREYCVSITGDVVRRKPGTENPKLDTGEVEVVARAAEILAESKTPPFAIEDDVETEEATRLKHRYLDLRRPEMQRNLRLRARVVTEIRRFLDARDFVEIETPILFKATPEGARDFLVPSRLQPGSFYALPQSPQILKQLLMVSGFDRYYQIARCFRDEDLRADRQPEFTQLDLEMSFVEMDDVLALGEELYQHLWREVLGVELPPFPRVPYAEAIRRFGTDHVDMRYGMELTDVAEIFADTSLGIFKKVLADGGIMRAIGVPGWPDMHDSQLKKYERQAMERGAKGLAWIIFKEGGEVHSPLQKHLSPAESDGLQKALGIGPGDVAFLAADAPQVVNPVLGALRMQIADDHDHIPKDDWAPCWVVDYPYFLPAEGGGWEPIHHPFTMPSEDWGDGDPDYETLQAKAYDIVINGVELASGSVRIHRPALQQKVFDALGIDRTTAEERFGFLLKAFEYGPPPHGGIAPGIDRTIMLMAGTQNIRDVIAFPKTQSASDLLAGAPSEVDPAALKELGIRIIPT